MEYASNIVPWLTEVVQLRITPTFAPSVRLIHRAVSEWFMTIANLMEKVQFVLRCQQGGTDRVHRRITPALVIKSTSLFEVFKEFHVRFAAPKVEIRDFEIAPD